MSHGPARPDTRLPTSGAASVSPLTSLRAKRRVEVPIVKKATTTVIEGDRGNDELHAMSMADFEELIKMELEGAERFLKVEHDLCACVTYDQENEEPRIMEMAMTELEMEVAFEWQRSKCGEPTLYSS